MNAEDWEYISEGGEHAIFDYRPEHISSGTTASSDFIHEKWNGKVLKISKLDMIMIIAQQQQQQHHQSTRVPTFTCLKDKVCCRDEDILKQKSKERIRIERHEAFQYSFIYQTLNKYVDVPTPIKLSIDFVFHLYIKTVQQVNRKVIQIPESRIQDWIIPNSFSHADNENDNHNCNNNDNTNSTRSFIRASLLPNYRVHLNTRTIRIPSINVRQNILSIEIKPKAGYIPYSPLIQPQNKAKFFHTRFEILQQLYHKNIITKGWCNNVNVNSNSTDDDHVIIKRIPSQYNPLDLFSTHLDSIQNAIQQLFICPQNNLKIWYDNVLIYGDKSTSIHTTCSSISSILDDEEVYLKVLNDMFQFETSDNLDKNGCACRNMSIDKILQSKIEDILSSIIKRHSTDLMHTLKLLQKNLDILDHDGAIIIYEHLVQLCNGSLDETDRLIDLDYFNFKDSINMKDAEIELREKGFGIHAFLGSGSKEVHDFLVYCESVEKCFRSILHHHESSISSKSSSEMYIDEDKIEEWHSGARDLVRELKKDDCIGLLQNWLMSLMVCDISLFITLCPSSSCLDKATYPALTMETNEYSSGEFKAMTKNGLVFDYNIKIIDLDGKPAKKLRNRKKLESKFSQFQSRIHH